jgi:hypothetical protein
VLSYPDQVRAAERAARRKRRRGRGGWPLAVRLAELERFLIDRWGPTLPDDDAGNEDAFVMASQLANLADAETRVAGWLAARAPWMSITSRQALTARVIAKPLRWSSGALARRLNLTAEERDRLKITTIGAVDQTPEERVALRKERKRQRERDRRRSAGAIPQSERSAQAISRTKPWVACNISRATWYRLRTIARGENETNACPP